MTIIVTHVKPCERKWKSFTVIARITHISCGAFLRRNLQGRMRNGCCLKGLSFKATLVGITKPICIGNKISDFVFYKPKKNELLKTLVNKQLRTNVKLKRIQYKKSVMHSETSETNKFLNESLKDLKQSFCKKKYHMRVKYKGKSEEKKLFKKTIGTQSLIYEQRTRPGKRSDKENIKNQLDQKQSSTKKLTDLLKTQESLWRKSRRRQSTGQNAYAYLRESLKPRRKFKPLLSRNNSIIPDETETLLPKEAQLKISTKVSKLRKSLEYLKQNVKTSASLINSPNPVLQKSMFKQDRKSDGQNIQTFPVTNPLYLPKKYKKVWMDESFSLTLIDQPSLPSAIRSPVS